jgi:hypothetical protein
MLVEMAESLLIQVPDRTRELLDRLKVSFGVKTDAEVLTRALGLANMAVKVAGPPKVVTFSGAEPEVTLILNE